MKKPLLNIAFGILTLVTSQSIAQVADTAKQTATSQDTSKSGSAAKTQNNAATQSSATAAAPSADVLQAIAKSGYTNKLFDAVKTAGLDSLLKGAGLYTVFAPSDQAFTASINSDLAADKEKAATVLKNHVISGTYTKADIIKALTAGKGTATLKTISGANVTLKINANKNLELADANGNSALVTVFDLTGGNGVVHVINGLLLPKQAPNP